MMLLNSPLILLEVPGNLSGGAFALAQLVLLPMDASIMLRIFL
jgi:hypothetical protein